MISSRTLIGMGVVGLVAAGVGLLEDPSTASLQSAMIVTSLSFACLAAGALVNPRFERRDADVAIGIVRSVDERVIRSDEACDDRCVVCLDRIEEGMGRRYREEYVVAGVSVRTASGRYNHYCPECADDELSATDSDTRGQPNEQPARERRIERHVEKN